MLFVVRANQLLLKIKHSAILMINLNKNKIINKFSLTGDRFMLELHLKQRGFIYSGCDPFTKHHERIQKLRKINFREIGKACFALNTAYSDS